MVLGVVPWCRTAVRRTTGVRLYRRDQPHKQTTMTVRILKFEPDMDVIPQAIIWRPLRYCTLIIRNGQDDLDKYQGASFAIGNDIRFDLRVYQGHIHADVTVTLYLPEDVQDEDEVAAVVRRVTEEMGIPLSAVAWERGETIHFGKLERPPQDRLREKEARILVLKIAASQPNQSTTLAKLREEIPRYFDLSSADRTRSPSRKREELWEIIIRNTTSSHRAGNKTIFGQGWAEKTPDGIKVTRSGMRYLNSIGFLDSSDSDTPIEE